MSYSERVNTIGFNISESLRGHLPPIDYIAVDLHDRMKTIKNLEARAQYAADYAERLRYGADLDSIIGSATERSDISSLTFADIMSVFARQYLLDRATAQNPAKKGGRTQHRLDKVEMRISILVARKNVLEDMEVFDNVFAAAEDSIRYNAFESLAYEAVCLLHNVTDFQRKVLNHYQLLAGLLAEHKVKSALTENGYPYAFYSDIEQDLSFSSDITVPIGEWQNRQFIDIQVKSNKNGELVICEQDGYLIVEAPMPIDEDRFEMQPEHIEVLITAVQEYAKRRGIA